jgi:hypothetical protein
MNRRIFALAALAAASACLAAAQATGDSQASPWIGVWQGTLDGQPGTTLTLARDTGELGGTLVLDMVERDADGHAYVAASEPHTLMHPRLEGDTLTFSVRQPPNGGQLRHFAVALTPEGKARIHCTDCGQGAPVVDMERSR